MDGEQPGRRAVVAARAQRCRRASVRAALVLVALRVLLAVVGLHDLGASERAWALACASAVSVACLAEVVHLVAAFGGAARGSEGQGLPRVGAWARMLCRGSATVAACLVLCGVAVTFPQVPFGADGSSPLLEHTLGVLLVGALFASVAAVVSGAVWGTAEVVAGYHEPARRTGLTAS